MKLSRKIRVWTVLLVANLVRVPIAVHQTFFMKGTK